MIHKYTSLTWIPSIQVKNSNPVFLKFTHKCPDVNLMLPRQTLIFFVLKSSLCYFNTAKSTTAFPDTPVHNTGFTLGTSHFNSQVQAGY